MANPLFGQLLILSLLFINSVRIFFLKFGKVDSLAVLAPLCVVLSVLQIIAWKADVFSLTILFFSVFAFIINFRALLRFISGLYVDHYSMAFSVGAIFIAVLVILQTVLMILFWPYSIKVSDYNIEKKVVRLTGSFREGFSETGPFVVSNAQAYVYNPVNAVSDDVFVLFVPDKRADTSHYEPYLRAVANCGYKVLSVDYFSKDLKWLHNGADISYFRRMVMILKYMMKPILFEAEKEFYTYNTLQECKETFNLVARKIGDMPKVIFIGDEMTKDGIKDFCKDNNSVLGYFSLTDFEEYKSVGLGCVSQVAPLISYRLGIEEENNLVVPNLLASKSAEKIKLMLESVN